MKHFTLLAAVFFAHTTFAQASANFGAKIACSSSDQNEVVIFFSSDDSSIILTARDGVVAGDAPQVVIENLKRDGGKDASFSLNFGENTFGMIAKDFDGKTGTYSGAADYSIGSHFGASVSCELNYDLLSEDDIFVLGRDSDGAVDIKSLLNLESGAKKMRVFFNKPGPFLKGKFKKKATSNKKTPTTTTSKSSLKPSSNKSWSFSGGGSQSLGDLNESALKSRLGKMKKDGGYQCAKGVRESLNVLFGNGPKNGKNALDYNESVLAQWQTDVAKYKKVSMSASFKNFDVRVLLPASSCPNEMIRKYGHIELYYNGVWYSDFKQGSSVWDGDKARAARDPKGRRCFSTQDLYRLSLK